MVDNLAFQELGFDKFQRNAIIAIAQTCRARPVFKDMALMTLAADTVIFRTRRPKLIINLLADRPRDNVKKARPACAGIKFRV